MIVIAMLCQKGGVGKTTLVQNFSIEASSKAGTKVAVIDIDGPPQYSFIKWAQRRMETFPDEDNPVLAIQSTTEDLEEHLEICRDGDVDIVFIDTGGKVERPAAEAARLADFAIVPTGVGRLDIEALGDTLSIAALVNTPCCIVINLAETHSKSTNTNAAKDLSDYSVPICPHIVFRRIEAKHAADSGLIAGEYEPNGKTNDEIITMWRWITKRFITPLKKEGNRNGKTKSRKSRSEKA